MPIVPPRAMNWMCLLFRPRSTYPYWEIKLDLRVLSANMSCIPPHLFGDLDIAVEVSSFSQDRALPVIGIARELRRLRV